MTTRPDYATNPYDPEPPKKSPDPILGNRTEWEWCADCGAIQPPGHKHPCDRCGGSGEDPEHAGVCGVCGDTDTLARDDGNLLKLETNAIPFCSDCGAALVFNGANGVEFMRERQTCVLVSDAEDHAAEVADLCARWRETNDARLDTLTRAEFAESLLCALAFDHGTECMEYTHGICAPATGFCVFCDAARKP